MILKCISFSQEKKFYTILIKIDILNGIREFSHIFYSCSTLCKCRRVVRSHISSNKHLKYFIERENMKSQPYGH